MANFGDKVRKVRELKDFTQEYVASQLGISQRAYSKLETGETKMTWDRIAEIAKVLDIEPIDLVGFDESKIFNNCTQSGNDTQVINYHTSDDLEKLYANQIDALKQEIEYLRTQNQKLLEVIGAK